MASSESDDNQDENSDTLNEKQVQNNEIFNLADFDESYEEQEIQLGHEKEMEQIKEQEKNISSEETESDNDKVRPFDELEQNLQEEDKEFIPTNIPFYKSNENYRGKYNEAGHHEEYDGCDNEDENDGYEEEYAPGYNNEEHNEGYYENVNVEYDESNENLYLDVYENVNVSEELYE